MGNAAFLAGAETMQRDIDTQRARKQGLEDEERRFKVAGLYDKGHQLAATIPSLTGDARDQAMQQLVNVEQSIADAYHPTKAPGAIMRDWNFVSGLIHRKPRPVPINYNPAQTTTRTPDITVPGSNITIPGSSYDVRPAASAMSPVQRQQTQQYDQARQMAALDVAATGLTPEQQAQAEQRVKEAQVDWTLDWAKRHGVSGEALQELTEQMAGLTKRARLLPLGKPYKGPDGKYYQPMRDPDTGLLSEEAMPAGYTPPQLAPVRAWKRDQSGRIISVELDRLTNQPIPGTENPDLLPPPFLTQRISTGTYHFIDENNEIHAIPEVRTSGPALVTGGRAPSAGSRASSGAAATPGAGPVATGDRVIGIKGSAPLNKARSTYADAVKINALADDIVKSSNSEKDTLFVLSLIRSEAGRVNQKEIDALFQAGGIAEGPERWAAKIGHGELPQTLREQLQAFTAAQVDAAQAAVDALRSTPGDLKKKAKANVDAGMSDDEFLQKVK